MIRNIAWVLTFAASSALVVAQPLPPKPIIEQIEDAWKARAEKVKTAEFELEVEKYYPKGSISDEHRKKDTVMPNQDTRVKYKARYIIRDNKLRLEEDGTRWNGAKFEETRELFVCEQDRDLSYESVRSQIGTGNISNEPSDFRPAKRDPFRPITLCYRGSDGRMAPYTLADFSPSIRGIISGIECLSLTQVSSNGTSRTLWLNPTMDWVVVRDTLKYANGELTETDFRYEINPIDQLPVLKGWRSRRLNAGKRASYTSDVVVKAARFNTSIDGSKFQLDFPSGATVIRDGVSRLEILQVTTAGDLAPHPLSQSTQQFARESSFQQTLGWVSIGLCVFVTISVIGLFRYRQKRNSV